MNAFLKKKSLNIMENIMTRPCSSCFNKSQLLPTSKKDRQGIKSTSYLSLFIIKQKLKENKYNKIHQWFEDMDQLWIDLENLPNVDKFTLSLIEESKIFFLKERKKIDIFSSNLWSEELSRYRSKLTKLMTYPPPRIKQIAANLNNSLIPKTDVSALSEHELQCFISASNLMETEEEFNEINRILIELQPDIKISENSCTLLDVSTLSVQTINALRTFMKAKLEEKGLKYPT